MTAVRRRWPRPSTSSSPFNAIAPQCVKLHTFPASRRSLASMGGNLLQIAAKGGNSRWRGNPPAGGRCRPAPLCLLPNATYHFWVSAPSSPGFRNELHRYVSHCSHLLSHRPPTRLTLSDNSPAYILFSDEQLIPGKAMPSLQHELRRCANV
jgi:hypothetical protein